MWPASVIVWSDPVTNTPSIIQVDFGSWGENVPGDGEAYCAPTSIVMGLYYLSANGFTQLAPAEFVSQDDQSTQNLELVIAGLMNTSVSGGASGDELTSGVGNYLSACGIGPEQYSFASSYNPDLAWIATRIQPNVEQNPSVIVLACFSVGWYAWNADQTELQNFGGHFLTPLTADPAGSQLVLNNAFPASFFNVPNVPGNNPQTVTIAAVPQSWLDTNPPPSGLYPSLSYVQVKSQTEGQDNSYAILWGGQAWSIASTATPNNPPSTWNLATLKQINTNGGTLSVIAPLAGSGGLVKMGAGTLCLTNDNSLTGANQVLAGVLASTAATQTPFGTGQMSISGAGTLAVSSVGNATLTIASGSNAAQLNIGPGAVLQVTGSAQCSLTIGGYDDGSTPNITRLTAGTLTISLDAGMDELGANQIIMIQGTAANLLVVTNGMVAPYIVGQNSDGSGAFLNYVTTNSIGFQAASTVSSADVGIGSVSSDVIYEVINTQEVAGGATASIAALEMNGGTIEGGGTLQVGSQASGECAGILMNAGSIAAGSLAFGGAEGVIYTGNGVPTTISAGIAGSGGLTTFGPGTLMLTTDNKATLSGPINVASGVLTAAGDGSATGSGDVLVNKAAQLTISGNIAGSVSVSHNGMVLLQEGTIQGNLTTDAEGDNSAMAGGILQGAGVVDGAVKLLGLIQSGPTAGLLTFNGKAVVGGGAAGFYWRLQALVDDTTSSPGVGWNALVFNSETQFGTKGAPVSFYLDFSALNSDPDGPPVDQFWNVAHTWTLITFPAGDDVGIYWQAENFTYGAGNFDIDVDWKGQAVKLTWTPASTTQSLLQRMAKRAALRRKAALASPQPNT